MRKSLIARRGDSCSFVIKDTFASASHLSRVGSYTCERCRMTVRLTVYHLECPQKVQTTKTLTHRIFQLKLIGRNVVQGRVETFGVIDVFKKRLQTRLRLLKGLILVQIHFFPLYGLLRSFLRTHSRLAGREWT